MHVGEAGEYRNNTSPLRPTSDVKAKDSRRVNFRFSDNSTDAERVAYPPMPQGKPPIAPLSNHTPRSILKASHSSSPSKPASLMGCRVSFEEADDDADFSEPTLRFAVPPPREQIAPDDMEERTHTLEGNPQPSPQQRRGASTTPDDSPVITRVRDVLPPDDGGNSNNSDGDGSGVYEYGGARHFPAGAVGEAPWPLAQSALAEQLSSTPPSAFSDVSVSPPSAERHSQEMNPGEAMSGVLHAAIQALDPIRHRNNTTGQDTPQCSAPLPVEGRRRRRHLSRGDNSSTHMHHSSDARPKHQLEHEHGVHEQERGLMDGTSPPRLLAAGRQRIGPIVQQQDLLSASSELARAGMGVEPMEIQFDNDEEAGEDEMNEKGGDGDHSAVKGPRQLPVHPPPPSSRLPEPIAAAHGSGQVSARSGEKDSDDKANSAMDLIIAQTSPSERDVWAMDPNVRVLISSDNKHYVCVEGTEKVHKVSMHRSDPSTDAKLTALSTAQQQKQLQQTDGRPTWRAQPLLVQYVNALSAELQGTQRGDKSSDIPVVAQQLFPAALLSEKSLLIADDLCVPLWRIEHAPSSRKDAASARHRSRSPGHAKKHKRRHKYMHCRESAVETVETPNSRRHSRPGAHAHSPHDSGKSKSSEKRKSLEKAKERRLDAIRSALVGFRRASPSPQPRNITSYQNKYSQHAATAEGLIHTPEGSQWREHSPVAARVRRVIFPPTRTPSPQRGCGNAMEERRVTHVRAMRTFARSISNIARAMRQSDLFKMV